MQSRDGEKSTYSNPDPDSNQEGMKKKKLHEGMGDGGGGASIALPPSIFKSIQPIDMKLGMCNNCPVCIQLIIVTWHLIGFHGNHSNIMT